MFQKRFDVITIKNVLNKNFKWITWKKFPKNSENLLKTSVADLDPNPDPDPPDPHVFGPPGSGSGSISQRYGSGSGSGSFFHKAEIIRKTLISTVLWSLVDFLSLKNYVNKPSKSNTQKNLFKLVFVGVLMVNDENSRIRIRIHTKMS